MAMTPEQERKQEREWWTMRVKHPFVGDLQQKLDAFQEKLIAAGEQPVPVPSPRPQGVFSSLFGFDLF